MGQYGELGSGSSSIRRFHITPHVGADSNERDQQVVAGTFRGEHHNKVDAKGRVSIPASFRRVLEKSDPEWTEGLNARMVIVYGDSRRKQLECFTIDAIEKVADKIERMPRGSKRRKALSRLYNGQSQEISVDETGRLVLTAKLREKIGIEKEAYFVGDGDVFEIWHPATYDEEMDAGLDEDEDFDPDADPSIYLDGDEEG